MHDLTISEESVDTSGALSVVHAASDELVRRYGGGGDTHLSLDELRTPHGFFLVARRDGHLAGGVGVRSIGERGVGWGEVKRLWVRPDLRRGGIAKSLMNEVLRQAPSKGLVRLYLETGPAQPEAIAFYASTGWTQIDEFPPAIFSHDEALRFMKDL